jgi:WG containing repeat
MITDVSQASGYATRSEVIEIYVNGIVHNLISLNTPTQQPKESPASRTSGRSINDELSPKTQQPNKSGNVGLEKFENANGKYGYRKQDGTIVIAARFDRAFSFTNGLANVELDGKRGYVNDRGEIVIPLIYEYLGFFSDGLALAELNGKYGFIDSTGGHSYPV